MSIVLQGLSHFPTAYINEVLIYSETVDLHLYHLQKAFDQLREHDGLYRGRNSCCIFVVGKTSPRESIVLIFFKFWSFGNIGF